jgi:hypothetical protein
MVGEFGEVLLMDWGVAILHDPAAVGDNSRALISELVPTREKAHNPAGTPAYMAVEQTRFTAEGIGPWTDVYLLGGMLYFLLTGTPPHGAEDSAESFAKAIRGEVIPPHVAAPRRLVPEELITIAMKALSKEPKDRHGSVTEFLGQLAAYQTGAGKRSESLALARAVEQRMQQPGRDYESLAECNNMILQALALWPRNIQALHLRSVVTSEFANQALQNNDLVLARVMARGIGRSGDMEPVLEEITRKESLRRREMRNLRILKWIALILLVVVVIDFFIIFRSGFIPLGISSGRTPSVAVSNEPNAADWQQMSELLTRTASPDSAPAASLLARALTALSLGDQSAAAGHLDAADALIAEDSELAPFLLALRERLRPLPEEDTAAPDEESPSPEAAPR